QGHKMSKSRGNLVKVSQLRADGVDPRSIRLALLSHHYRSDWEWTDDVLAAAQKRLISWEHAFDRAAAGAAAAAREVRECLARDLDAPGALAIIDAWADSAGSPDRSSSALLRAVVHNSLG